MFPTGPGHDRINNVSIQNCENDSDPLFDLLLLSHQWHPQPHCILKYPNAEMPQFFDSFPNPFLKSRSISPNPISPFQLTLTETLQGPRENGVSCSSKLKTPNVFYYGCVLSGLWLVNLNSCWHKKNKRKSIPERRNLAAKIPEEKKVDMYWTKTAFRGNSKWRCRFRAGLAIWEKQQKTLDCLHFTHTQNQLV